MNLPVEPVRKAARDWTVPVLILVCLGTLVMCAAVVLLGSQVGRLDDSIAADQANREVTDCRAKYATDVTNAQTDYSLAFGAALTAFARGEETESLLLAVEDAGQHLDEARDARVLFENNPTGEC